MQSASHRGLLDIEYLPTRREKMWERAREWMGGGRLVAGILVLLLTISIAKSTATAAWVPGIDAIVTIAVIAALLMGVLAVVPIPEALGLGVGLLLAPVGAVWAAWPQLHAQHHSDVFGRQLIGVWWNRITSGDAATDPSFYLVLICLLMWITGGWLAWCVLRWRKPMLGLIPGAAAFATNVLNLPKDQNGYTLAVLVFTLALLLWTNYTGPIANAVRANVKLSGDARWDFWESGLVAMAALIVLGIMLPPLSTADRTLDVESGIFTSWAQLQEQLNHPGFFANGGGSGVTGFSDDVRLTGSLHKSAAVVFTYTVSGDYASARYFRGLDETLNLGSEWRYSAGNGVRVTVAKNQPLTMAESYQKLAVAGFNVHMLRPPIGNSDLLFYPGQFYKVDRPTQATQVPLGLGIPVAPLYSVDRLGSIQPNTSSGNYAVTVEYSTATASELQGAGTNYPDWVAQFDALPRFGYRTPRVLSRIHDLAVQIVKAANATTPYDQAVAIETYLRDPRYFKYNLDIKPPAGVDPMEWFLFDSREGYCEFFATAMGDMLRSLNIPVRLVNGFGPGSYESTLQANVVKAEDAHTWVEVYFPSPDGSAQPYGWIPFEPTADGQYTPIQRGLTGINPCLRDNGCDPSGLDSGTTTPSTPKVSRIGGVDVGGGPTGGGLRVGSFDATALTSIVAVAIAVVLILLVVVSRYLRPRSVMSVWKRMLILARFAGADRPPGETPLELGRRLQRTFPEAAEPVRALTDGFVVAAYAPAEVAATSRASVMEAWSALRPLLLRRVFARLRPARP